MGVWPLVTHGKSLRTGRDCLATWTLASLGQKPRRPTSSRAISTGSSKTWHRAEATQGRSQKDSRGFLPASILRLFGVATARSTSSKVATIGNSILRGNLMWEKTFIQKRSHHGTFPAESTRPCNGTMGERISSRKASIGGLTTGSSRSTAQILRSLGMRATGGLDVPRLGDSQVLCLLTRASRGGASSLPRRRRILMVLWEMKI